MVFQVEDLGQLEETGVGGAVEGDEEVAHLGLPAGVDLGRGHAGLRRRETRGFEVADQEAVVAQENRVVVPAGALEGQEHVRPDGGVATSIFGDQLRLDLELEAHTVLGIAARH